jgi:hypothetical protein
MHIIISVKSRKENKSLDNVWPENVPLVLPNVGDLIDTWEVRGKVVQRLFSYRPDYESRPTDAKKYAPVENLTVHIECE